MEVKVDKRESEDRRVLKGRPTLMTKLHELDPPTVTPSPFSINEMKLSRKDHPLFPLITFYALPIRILLFLTSPTISANTSRILSSGGYGTWFTGT